MSTTATKPETAPDPFYEAATSSIVIKPGQPLPTLAQVEDAIKLNLAEAKRLRKIYRMIEGLSG